MLFTIHKSIKNKWIKLLWNSQKKSFAKIGTNCNVLTVPFIEGASHIEIGNDLYCGQDVRIEAWSKYGEQSFDPKIVLGNNIILTDRCYISCIDRVEIKDGVLLGRDVFITDNSHGDSSSQMLNIPPIRRPLSTKGPVIIEKNVWIGRQTTVLSGVTIGEGSIIGANSVVNKDIPAYCVAAGNPAKVIKDINP